MNAGFSPRLEVGHLSRAWSKNSRPRDRSGKAYFQKCRVRNKGLPPRKIVENRVSGSISRLGGVPRAINSSRESERRGGRSTSRSHLIDARETNRKKREGFASIYKVASQHGSTTPLAPA